MPMNPRLMRPLARRQAPAPAPSDPYFSQVSLLLHMDGANGSTTFTDSSPENHTVTAYGDAQVSTAKSKFGGASAMFDADGDYIQSTGFAGFQPGTTAQGFTAELWLYRESNNVAVYLAKHGGAAAWNGTDGLHIEIFTLTGASTLYFNFYGSAGVASLSSNTAVPVGEWCHLAFVYDGSTTGFFIDGIAQSATYSGFWGTVTNADFMEVGAELSGSASVDGYIDEVRITKAARYPIGQNFTPPTAAFPNQ